MCYVPVKAPFELLVVKRSACFVKFCILGGGFREPAVALKLVPGVLFICCGSWSIYTD